MQDFALRLWELIGGPFGSILGVGVLYSALRNLVLARISWVKEDELRRTATAKGRALREDIMLKLSNYQCHADYALAAAIFCLLAAAALFAYLHFEIPSAGNRKDFLVTRFHMWSVFSLGVLGFLAFCLELYSAVLREWTRQAMDVREVN